MFNKLGDLRAHTQVPFMALTATASESSVKAISDSLHLHDPVLCLVAKIGRTYFFPLVKVWGSK